MSNKIFRAIAQFIFQFSICCLILKPGDYLMADDACDIDYRNIKYGKVIPSENYSDQPYLVRTDDGAWLCILTTGTGREGIKGQHVISFRSTDQGKTWSVPVDVEPADGPEASYAVLLKVPYGRIYAFYNHNTDDIRQIKADNPPFEDGYCRRVDSQGYFVFKFSDDHGRHWSEKRYPIPAREMAMDRENPYRGKIKFFWNVGKAFTHAGAGYVPLHKVGGIGHGFFTKNEGVLLKSQNILIERDPEKIEWETLPDGEIGIRAPEGGGSIAGEHSFSVLSDGSFYCVFRTIDGHPAFTYSRDGGHTWDKTQYKRYADGRLMKHPRAANFAWKCANGKYLYWFHNHGGTWYHDRNPVWLCGGIEIDSPNGKSIQWSQPEIVLYDDDPSIRISYPDFIEEDGSYFLTETQKDIARVHEIDPELIEGLWSQFENATVATNGLILNISQMELSDRVEMPALPFFVGSDPKRADSGTKNLCAGFTLDLWVNFGSLESGQILLDNRTDDSHGFCLRTTTRQRIEIVLNDGRTENRWDCDPGMLELNRLHHIVVTVDGGPKIISFIVDGKLCDGGRFRQFGWGRFSPHLRDVNGDKFLRTGCAFDGTIMRLRIYNRNLSTSEAIGNFKAGI
ncbi:exo-alpha-sialidase [candidate division KSB1 bacterium]|nr:exo-alpha-sialidase [candidate division KSB1 bacterium]